MKPANSMMAPGEHDAGLILTEWSAEELNWTCRSTLEAVYPSFKGADIRTVFYPYIGLTHTIRRRGSGWIMRVSDHCRHAPRMVLEAIAVILGSKISRRRPPRHYADVYERFRKSAAVEASVIARRRGRGRKRLSHPEGRHHSLGTIMRDLNARYFNDQIEIERIGWGPRHSWGRLGHFDPVHRTITISPVLDSQRVPGIVVAFIVYHEMLHALFDGTGPEHRPHHPAHFQRAEKAYPDYDAARRFLSRYCSSRGRS